MYATRSYEAFISTSSDAVYYGGRYRFYTADLTMSMPVFKGQNRAWVQRNYDNFGTHASTTVEGNKLKLYNFGSTSTPSYVSGYWLSDPWDLSSITNVENSFIEYCACARNGADVIVKTAITASTSTEPTANEFVVATTTTTIPGITAGDNLYGKYLWLKIELEPSYSATGTPCLCRINLAINDVATTTSAHNALQSLTYTYDAVGNITQVKDLSGFGGHKTAVYTYDDLYRLTNASTTVPANGGYNQTFSYDRVGNILTSPEGTYTYAETNFANPHGATTIGAASLTYDNNGNVTAYGSDTHTWNYRDRLMKSTVGGVNTFYGYDFNNDRVMKGDGTATTTYANKYYNTLGATTTKHIFDNTGTLLATVEGNGEATSTNFVHTDHLGSTDIVVDEDGDVVEEADYLPFGAQRVNDTKTGFVEQRKFTSHEFDAESDLTYAKARYYGQNIAKFLSIDPIVSNLVNEKQRNIVLSDSQQQNSYSYARNNPLILIDSTGETSLFSWMLSPIGTAIQVAGARLGANLLERGIYQGERPTSAQLLRHASTLNPANIQAKAGSTISDTIQNSSLYQSKLTTIIQDKKSSGTTSFKNQKLELNYQPSDGDAFTAFGKIDIYVNATLQKDGAWNVSAHGSDLYNFSPDRYGKGAIIGAAVNAAYIGEKTGALTPFTTTVQFEHSVNTDNRSP